VREGLLCLLATEPKHGYQLKQEFEAIAGDGWPLNVGQVYSTLQRMETSGWVIEHKTDSGGRISYRLTVDGQAAMNSWLATPVDRTVAARDELSLKVLIGVQTGLISAEHVIGSQRSATMTGLQDFTALKAAATDTEVAWLLHLDRLIFSADAELRWLDHAEERLRDFQPDIQPSEASTKEVSP
jgi:DNA-binding PadR family transcriptional regulator